MKSINRVYQLLIYLFDLLEIRLKKALGWLGKPVILPYMGYGNQDTVYFRGRVLEDSGLKSPKIDASKWSNILSMVKRYLSQGLPGVALAAEFQGKTILVLTDRKGFFDVKFPVVKGLDGGWYDIKISLMHSPETDEAVLEQSGTLYFPGTNSGFGVISDVDDTFLVSNSTRMIKKLRLMLFKNATTRLPFSGVAAFYQALRAGADGKADNPIFYISSSEWNLYDLLVDFCEFQNIPRGPFLLRDINFHPLKFWKSGGGNHDHKIDKIYHLLTTYPELPFLLIGDSGQKDPDIYTKIATEFPGRISAIYIRDIGKKKKQKNVKKLAQKMGKLGIDMLLVKDTEEAARHAIKKGYIQPEALMGIIRDKIKNQKRPTEPIGLSQVSALEPNY